MPIETQRVVKRKRIQLPSGSTVDVPVITQITFKDPTDHYWESTYTINNSGQAHRDVHVASIPGNGASTDESGGASQDTSQLQVERLEVWRTKDPTDHYWQSAWAFDNKTVAEPPDAPPYFTTHEKTHIVKYINTPDDGNWIKSELIDKYKIKDPTDHYQESEFQLSNPPDNQDINGLTLDTDSDGNPTVAVDPNLPDITDSSNGLDPPWRLDPFQNIVDFSSTPPIFAVEFSARVGAPGTTPPSDGTWFVSSSPNAQCPPPNSCLTPTPDDPCQSIAPFGSWVAGYVQGIWWFLNSNGPAFSVKGVGSVGSYQSGYFTQPYPEMGYYQTTTPSTTLARTVSGGPLVVGGKQILGYVDTLTYSNVRFAFHYLSSLTGVGVYCYCGAAATWFFALMGGASNDGASIPVSVDVDGSPFTKTNQVTGTSQTWQALGLLDPNFDQTTPGFVFHGPIYCKRVS
jgi:hypothetical protein